MPNISNKMPYISKYAHLKKIIIEVLSINAENY